MPTHTCRILRHNKEIFPCFLLFFSVCVICKRYCVWICGKLWKIKINMTFSSRLNEEERLAEVVKTFLLFTIRRQKVTKKKMLLLMHEILLLLNSILLQTRKMKTKTSKKNQPSRVKIRKQKGKDKFQA